MKMLNKKIFMSFILIFCLGACSDWVEIETKYHENMTGSIYPSEYYVHLKKYKESDHPIAFGWFGNWTGKGASLENCMAGLPDSVDVISIWGNWRNLSEEQKLDLKYAQEVKGIKALMCFIIANIGDQITPVEVRKNYEENGFSSEEAAVKNYWGWNDLEPQSIDAAIKKYANSICDTIYKYNYDGFDIDYEPHYGSPGNMASYDDRMLLFIKTLRERLGVREKTGKLIVIDGEPQSIVPEAGEYLDYFIVQAYDCNGDSNLDRRLENTINNFEGILDPEEVAKRYIVTENFEKWSLTGGANYTDRYGNKMKSLEGMARWTPIINGEICTKGGVGTYHMEYEFRVSGYTGTYPFLRNAIRIMNPPIK